MKNKKIIAAAAILMAATVYTAQAAFTPVSWASATPGAPITIDYMVTESAGTYTYEYKVDNTSAGTIFGFEVTGSPGAGATISSPPNVTGTLSGGGAIWFFPKGLNAGQTSGILDIETKLAPGFNPGQAFDETAGPWAPSSGANYVPTPVPEPGTMVAGALLLLPFGASTLRIVRKHRMA